MDTLLDHVGAGQPLPHFPLRQIRVVRYGPRGSLATIDDVRQFRSVRSNQKREQALVVLAARAGPRRLRAAVPSAATLLAHVEDGHHGCLARILSFAKTDSALPATNRWRL